MTITLFRKKVTPKNGNKPFNKYITTLTNKQGENVYCDVRFNDGVDLPKEFPCIIEIDKKNANMSIKNNTVTDEQGEEKTYIRHTLWINAIKKVSPYIDHSLDDFE